MHLRHGCDTSRIDGLEVGVVDLRVGDLDHQVAACRLQLYFEPERPSDQFDPRPRPEVCNGERQRARAYACQEKGPIAQQPARNHILVDIP